MVGMECRLEMGRFVDWLVADIRKMARLVRLGKVLELKDSLLVVMGLKDNCLPMELRVDIRQRLVAVVEVGHKNLREFLDCFRRMKIRQLLGDRQKDKVQ